MTRLKTRSWLSLTLILTGACLLSGCATKPPVEECSWVRPIYLARQDLTCMSRGTKQQILTHDEAWAQHTVK